MLAAALYLVFAVIPSTSLCAIVHCHIIRRRLQDLQEYLVSLIGASSAYNSPAMLSSFYRRRAANILLELKHTYAGHPSTGATQLSVNPMPHMHGHHGLHALGICVPSVISGSEGFHRSLPATYKQS